MPAILSPDLFDGALGALAGPMDGPKNGRGRPDATARRVSAPGLLKLGRTAREVSYAPSASTRRGRAVIRAMENVTGRLGLIRRAAGYEEEVAEGRDFWEVMCDRYGIRLDVRGGSLEAIPARGPLVVVANHPYGVLDGLVMGRILSGRRGGDFRILAHSVFSRAPEVAARILPVDFDGTPQAAEANVAMRAEALRYLRAGGAVGVFPAGAVSTAPTPLGHPVDAPWGAFTARLIARSGATVVPVFFEGRTSRLFQVASHLHQTLRMGMLLREFRARTDAPLRLVVGEPVPAEAIAALRGDAPALMAALRRATYALSPTALPKGPSGRDL
jgi:putative hemolysin